MHHLVITRAHLHVGQLLGKTEIKFYTADGGEVTWEGFVTRADEPVAITVPGDSTLFVSHSNLSSVSFHYKDQLPRTSKEVFEVVGLTTKAIVACDKCGKKCYRTKVFSQTLNPFNTNDDGTVKTREQIKAELEPLAVEWRSGPIYHAKCED